MNPPIDGGTSTATLLENRGDTTKHSASDNQQVASPNSSATAAAPSMLSSSALTRNDAASSSESSTKAQQAYTTEIVKALFGRDGSSGVVVGNYSCSFQRQSGRLYVSTDALFFYSVRTE